MQAHSPLLIRSNACGHTLTALSVCRHMLKHVWLSKSANTRRYTLGSWYVQHALHSWYAQHLQTHAQLSTQETESRYMLRSWNMPTNSQPSSHMQTNAQISIQADEWRHTLISWYEPTTHMQIPAQLLIQADSCRNLASLGYVHTRIRPSIRACTCILSIHADAYSHTLSTNAE